MRRSGRMRLTSSAIVAAGMCASLGVPLATAEVRGAHHASKTTALLRAELIEALNAARASSRRCGRDLHPAAPALAASSALTTAAQLHTAELVALGRFTHVGRDGAQPWDRAKRVGYAWRQIGENISVGEETAAGAVAQWLRSEGHCRNVMSPRFRDVGVGYAPGGPHRHTWTVVFATR